MYVYGPVPSRRLGKSLGINNIPHKVCSYSCVYCQVGKTRRLETHLQPFYNPKLIFNDVNNFVDYLAERIKISLKGLSTDFELMGVGIGAPNGNYYKGTIEHAPNLSWKGIVPITDLLSKKINLPVFLTNDANAAAVGEMRYGGAKNMKNFIIKRSEHIKKNSDHIKELQEDKNLKTLVKKHSDHIKELQEELIAVDTL